MGRPLKIKKSTTTDIGFNALVDLVNSTAPSPVWNGTEYLGVVGGNNTVDTSAYPTVKCRVYITDSYSTEADGFIIRQKGSRKYLVGTATAIDPANAVVGVSLQIVSLGDTNWQSMGAPAGAAVGTIFTPTAASAGSTTGTASEVGVCVLTSDLSPTAGNMSISYFSDDSTETAISKLTNKFLQNFAGGETGGNANTGDVWSASQVINNVEFAANFFSDEGVTAKSGADVATWASGSQLTTGNLDLAIVENYNS